MVRFEYPARLCGYSQGHAILTVDPPLPVGKAHTYTLVWVCPQRCVDIQLWVWIQEDREMDQKSTLRTLPVCPCARRGQSCSQTASRQSATSGDGRPTPLICDFFSPTSSNRTLRRGAPAMVTSR
jgi:hypothetical protein